MEATSYANKIYQEVPRNKYSSQNNVDDFDKHISVVE